MFTPLYVIFAILGLSFLIFIHELGHYWMARRVGMRVETFAIGFGKPVYQWERDGVNWQIGWILFGGYVKIAGTESDDDLDPYEVPDGFFGKKPWDRIKVAFMGPFVNLVFAFFAFSVLWFTGGREKSFTEFTHKIGWVDPKSELYAAGVRPGDEIVAYGSQPFQSEKDHLYAPMIGPETLQVHTLKVDQINGTRTPSVHSVKTYPNPSMLDSNIVTAGILSSASYLVYDKLPDGKDNELLDGSPLKGSGIKYGDRIVWIDGQVIYSNKQMSEVLNDGRVLLTVQRDDEILQRRVPRVKAEELRPDPEFREELIDWQHEAGINSRRFQDLWAIPYNLTHDGVVENQLRFIDRADQKKAFPKHIFSEMEQPLLKGDKIIAVQGVPITASHQLLKGIQEKQVAIIVSPMPERAEAVVWNEADATFDQGIDWESLAKIAESIGTEKPLHQMGKMRLLEPVVPKRRIDFPMHDKTKSEIVAQMTEVRRGLEQIADPDQRAQALNAFDAQQNALILGLYPQDLPVRYNPGPLAQFSHVSKEISTTLRALASGALSPKYITGPVGIVHVVQSTSQTSFREAFFWIGAISLNLGILNLLPIPLLDGGTILLSFFEMLTRRRINPKVLEKIVVVFMVLLISFFLFLTYNDLLRVFGKFL